MIDEFYKEVILEHNSSNHNYGEIDKYTSVERGHNPNCGDDLSLILDIENDVVTNASFIGSGCAISKASMSIMIDMIKGKDIKYANKVSEIFLELIRGNNINDSDKELLGDAIAFENIANMPARVKCATLGWHCLVEALNENT